MGNYPGVTLKDARKARDEARKTREGGSDPVQARQIERATATASRETSFAAVAAEFHQIKAGSWSASYAEKWCRLIEKDLTPWIGSLPLADITAPVLLAAIRRTERRGAIDAAHSLRQYAGQVFRHGIATGRCERNPAADLAGALKPLQVKHMGSVTEPMKAGALLRDIDGYSGQPLTRGALALSALLFQRPGNMRAMEWAEVNADAAVWTIPAAKMKRTVHGKVNGRPHLVPLNRPGICGGQLV